MIARMTSWVKTDTTIRFSVKSYPYTQKIKFLSQMVKKLFKVEFLDHWSIFAKSAYTAGQFWAHQRIPRTKLPQGTKNCENPTWNERVIALIIKLAFKNLVSYRTDKAWRCSNHFRICNSKIRSSCLVNNSMNFEAIGMSFTSLSSSFHELSFGINIVALSQKMTKIDSPPLGMRGGGNGLLCERASDHVFVHSVTPLVFMCPCHKQLSSSSMLTYTRFRKNNLDRNLLGTPCYKFNLVSPKFKSKS